MVFYRKYRPQKFSDLVGQEGVVEILLSQLMSGKLSHGYLFCGPKGTGKTSTARILAKAINCKVYEKLQTKNYKLKTDQQKLVFGEPCNKCISCIAITEGSSLDVLEIDAASNRGIDEIRELRERVVLSPVSARFKVYIIDEAHMLTQEAFNAFLKTLEEPPSHAIFILCTTSFSKLPSTIISRLARFNFKRAGKKDLAAAIEKIIKVEGIKIEDKAKVAIAQAADGGYRDAVLLLDQLAASGKTIKEEDVKNASFFSPQAQVYEFIEALSQKDTVRCVTFVEKILKEGTDMSSFTKDLIIFLEKLLFIKIGADIKSLDFGDSQLEEMEKLAGSFQFEALQSLMKLFLIAENEIKLYPLSQIPLVLAICKFCGEPKESQESRQRRGTTLAARVKNQGSESQEAPKTDTKITSSQKIPKGSRQSLSEIEAKWGEFLNKIRPINVHLVALLRSTKPAQFDGNNLKLEVFFRFHKEKLEEPRIRDILENSLSETMGTNITLELVLASRTTKPTKTVKASNLVDISGDELAKIAQEIFSE